MTEMTRKVMIYGLTVTGLLFVVCGGGLWTLVSRLSPGYETRRGEVHFRKFNNLNWSIERRRVEGANPAELRTVWGSGGLYAVDDRQAYFEGRSIDGSDPDSFRVLDWRQQYACDRHWAYSSNMRISDDPAKFVVLSRGYARDDSHVYYGSQIVEQADPKTFIVTGTASSHAEDKNHRFNMGRLIDEDSTSEPQADERVKAALESEPTPD